MAASKAAILNFEKSDNTTNIKIRITHNNRPAYIPTDMFVKHTGLDEDEIFQVEKTTAKIYIKNRNNNCINTNTTLECM